MPYEFKIDQKAYRFDGQDFHVKALNDPDSKVAGAVMFVFLAKDIATYLDYKDIDDVCRTRLPNKPERTLWIKDEHRHKWLSGIGLGELLRTSKKPKAKKLCGWLKTPELNEKLQQDFIYGPNWTPVWKEEKPKKKPAKKQKNGPSPATISRKLNTMSKELKALNERMADLNLIVARLAQYRRKDRWHK